jgi:hypothetical protein
MYKLSIILNKPIDTGTWHPTSKGDMLYTIDQGKPYRCIVTKEDIITNSHEGWGDLDWDELPNDEGDGDLYVDVEDMPQDEYRQIKAYFSSQDEDKTLVLQGMDLSKVKPYIELSCYEFSDRETHYRKIVIDASMINFDAYVLPRTERINADAYRNNKDLKQVVIPDSVTIIRAFAFTGCVNLKRVVIPESVKAIEMHAFKGCENLTEINFPNALQSIGRNSFQGCKSLERIVLPDSVSILSRHVFRDCSNLKEIVVPKTMSIIDDWAFSGCSSLESFTIPNGLTEIGWCAFSGCSSLTSIEFPSSVIKIGSSAFAGCTGLTSVFIPDSVTDVVSSAFQGCNHLKLIKIGELAYERNKTWLPENVEIQYI